MENDNGFIPGLDSFLIVGLQQLISDFDGHPKVGTAKALIPINSGQYGRVDCNHPAVPIKIGLPDPPSVVWALCTMRPGSASLMVPVVVSGLIKPLAARPLAT
jgi:hypothetical protein